MVRTVPFCGPPYVASFYKNLPIRHCGYYFFIIIFFFLLLVLEWLLFGGVLFVDSMYQRLLYKVHTSNTEMSF